MDRGPRSFENSIWFSSQPAADWFSNFFRLFSSLCTPGRVHGDNRQKPSIFDLKPVIDKLQRIPIYSSNYYFLERQKGGGCCTSFPISNSHSGIQFSFWPTRYLFFVGRTIVSIYYIPPHFIRIFISLTPSDTCLFTDIDLLDDDPWADDQKRSDRSPTHYTTCGRVFLALHFARDSRTRDHAKQ